MERQFVLTIAVQRVPDDRRQKVYRKALMDKASWVKEVTFLDEGGRAVVRVVGEGVSVDQSRALSTIRTELQQHSVQLVYGSSDVGEYTPKSDGCISGDW